MRILLLMALLFGLSFGQQVNCSSAPSWSATVNYQTIQQGGSGYLYSPQYGAVVSYSGKYYSTWYASNSSPTTSGSGWSIMTGCQVSSSSSVVSSSSHPSSSSSVGLSSSSMTGIVVTTQLLSMTSNSMAYQLSITNHDNVAHSGIKARFYLDRSDQSAPTVAEMDYSSSPYNALTVTDLQGTWLSYVQLDLGSNSLQPGQSATYNIRHHLSNWDHFNLANDYSFLPIADGQMRMNTRLPAYQGDSLVWGVPAPQPVLPLPLPQASLKAQTTAISSNSISITLQLTNPGLVPLQNLTVTYSKSKCPVSQLQAVVDWSNIPSLSTTQSSIQSDSSCLITFKAPASYYLAVGDTASINLRLFRQDYGSLDFSKDLSLPSQSLRLDSGIIVTSLGLQIFGPSVKMVDSDGDGYPDALEIAAGTNPYDATSFPKDENGLANMAIPDRLVLQDTTTTQIINYTFAPINGYQVRQSVPMQVNPGVFTGGKVPLIAIWNGSGAPDNAPSIPQDLKTGRYYHVTGSLNPGQSVDMPFPLPVGYAGLRDTAGVLIWHFSSLTQKWEQLSVKRIVNGVAYATVTSFSPFYLSVKLNTHKTASGTSHHLIVMPDGTLWGAGSNDHGQLGLGQADSVIHDVLVKIPMSSTAPIVGVAAAGNYSLALDGNGNVWSFGDNSSGQLGLGTLGGFNSTPQQVLGGNNQPITSVTSIAAGSSHALAVSVANAPTVLGWGDNSKGQLGLGNTTPNALVATVIPLPSLPTSTDPVTVAAGAVHSVVIPNGYGTWYWAFGDNSLNQLGYPCGTTTGTVACDVNNHVLTPQTIQVDLGHVANIVNLPASDGSSNTIATDVGFDNANYLKDASARENTTVMGIAKGYMTFDAACAGNSLGCSGGWSVLLGENRSRIPLGVSNVSFVNWHNGSTLDPNLALTYGYMTSYGNAAISKTSLLFKSTQILSTQQDPFGVRTVWNGLGDNSLSQITGSTQGTFFITPASTPINNLILNATNYPTPQSVPIWDASASDSQSVALFGNSVYIWGANRSQIQAAIYDPTVLSFDSTLIITNAVSYSPTLTVSPGQESNVQMYFGSTQVMGTFSSPSSGHLLFTLTSAWSSLPNWQSGPNMIQARLLFNGTPYATNMQLMVDNMPVNLTNLQVGSGMIDELTSNGLNVSYSMSGAAKVYMNVWYADTSQGAPNSDPVSNQPSVIVAPYKVGVFGMKQACPTTSPCSYNFMLTKDLISNLQNQVDLTGKFMGITLTASQDVGASSALASTPLNFASATRKKTTLITDWGSNDSRTIHVNCISEAYPSDSHHRLNTKGRNRGLF